MPYLLFHKQVRNDDHCPICRIYNISVHETMEEAIELVKKHPIVTGNIGEEIDMTVLPKGEVLWIDEWIRRRNGDAFQIIPVSENVQYDLSQREFNWESKTSGNLDFLLVHTAVNKHEYCPDNIQFDISFHSTAEIAAEQAELELDDENTLKDKGSVWISDGDVDGDHYQIVKLVYNETVCLNSYCPNIQVSVW